MDKLFKTILFIALVASISEAIRLGEWNEQKYKALRESHGPQVDKIDDKLRGPGIFIEENKENNSIIWTNQEKHN